MLLFGSEAISTIERYAHAGDRPDFTEHAGGSLEDRGYGLRGIASMHRAAHGLAGGPSQYALAENARRARLKQTREEYAAAKMGEDLRRAGDRPAALSYFVKTLSSTDRAQLRRMLSTQRGNDFSS